MSKAIPTIIIVAVTALVLAAMYVAWRARQRRQASLPHSRPVPTDTGACLLDQELLYVATTVADQPLDRIAVSGLGYPAKARVDVFEKGIVLHITGASDSFIPNRELRGVGRATWTIDRAVEPGGLVVIGWTMADDEGRRADVDSYLRVVETEDSSDLIRAIEERIAVNSGNGAQ